VPASLADYRPALSRFFARRIADPVEVEDLVQEALLRLVASGCNGQAPDNPQAWLFKVAQNLVADHFRRPRHVGLDPFDLMEQAPPERATQEDARQCADLQYLMEEALAELSATCQAVFIMRRFEDCDTAEIARRVGVSRRMVQKYLVQAVTHLYVRLAPITEDRR
jgi:RNA polymerase sigma-70 factor (ECF subfamily)